MHVCTRDSINYLELVGKASSRSDCSSAAAAAKEWSERGKTAAAAAAVEEETKHRVRGEIPWQTTVSKEGKQISESVYQHEKRRREKERERKRMRGRTQREK